MKRIVIFVLLCSILNATSAKADDPCFDGMCSIEVNCTTGKTTITRLSDAEIAIRLAQKAEQNRLIALLEANKPKPVVLDTPTIVVSIPVKEIIVVTPTIETKTAQAVTPVLAAIITAPTSVVETKTAPIIVVETKTATPAIVETLTAIVATTPKIVVKKTIKKKGKKLV
jgi:TPP-dependent 2-oxoacid decarboxylase